MNQMRSLVPPESPPPQCEAISWTVPHHFTEEARTQLDDLSNKLGLHLQNTLHELYEDAAISCTGMSEHFTAALFALIQQERKAYYYLPVVSGHELVGLLEMPYETCSRLIALMLKNPQAEIGSGGELSSLEESILMDIAGPMAESVIAGLVQYGCKSLAAAETLVKGDALERFPDIDDMCQLSFEAPCSSGTLEWSLYLLNTLIDPLVGSATVDRSPETLRKMPERIIERLHDVSMQVTVRLSEAMIDLQDVLMLEKNDVLVLERDVSMPADVLVNGRACFNAWPARHHGYGAVVMAGPKSPGQSN